MSKSNAPSPFRLVVSPAEAKSHVVECPPGIHTLGGAKRYAKGWAGDCGKAGEIFIQEADGYGWRSLAMSSVSGSRIHGWCAP